METEIAESKKIGLAEYFPKKRAETLYKKSRWIVTRMHGKNEIKFEITSQDWENINATKNKERP